MSRHRADGIARLVADDLQMLGALTAFDTYLSRLYYAVQVEKERLDDRSNVRHWQIDNELITGVLRNVLRAGETLMEVGLDVGRDVEACASSMPGIKDARDIIEHADEYVLGIGRLQHDGLPVRFSYTRDDAIGTAVATANPPVVVDVGAAIEPALQLTRAMHAAIEKWIDGRTAPEFRGMRTRPQWPSA